MKFMTVDEYREKCYTPDSRPSKRKLIRLIKEGAIRGKKQGMVFYVDLEAENNSSGNSLVDKVLNQHRIH